jgi:hypothetical protein
MPTKGRQAAQKRYNSKPEQVKRRTARNTARRRMIAAGKARKGDGKDVDHKDGNPRNNSKSNLRVQSKSTNRSIKRNSKGGRRGK